MLAIAGGHVQARAVDVGDDVAGLEIHGVNTQQAARGGALRGELLEGIAKRGRVERESGDNQVKAADLLGIHRNTLRKKLQEYGVLS